MTVRPFVPVAVFTVLAVAPVLPARADETVPLRYISTTIVSTRLKAHPELNGVVLIPSNNTVRLRGSADQIAGAKAVLAQLDVPPVQYSAKVEVIRCTVDQDGKVTERTVLAPLISTLDGLPAEVGTDTQRMALTLLSNPDGTVTVSGEFRQADAAGDIGLWAKNERRVALGAKVRFLGLTDSPDKALRKDVREGKVVTDRGAYTAFYYDLTVQRIDPATGQP